MTANTKTSGEEAARDTGEQRPESREEKGPFSPPVLPLGSFPKLGYSLWRERRNEGAAGLPHLSVLYEKSHRSLS